MPRCTFLFIAIFKLLICISTCIGQTEKNTMREAANIAKHEEQEKDMEKMRQIYIVKAQSRRTDNIKRREEVTMNSFKENMVFIKSDTFSMGNLNGEPDEKPVHLVRLSDYKLSKYEVTRLQWFVITRDSSIDLKTCPNCPVENISYSDIQSFIKRLNDVTKASYRLPTESEWEYAARHNKNKVSYDYSGSNIIDDIAWYSQNSGGKTHPIGSKIPNEFGIYDMNGNVYEWCSDIYGRYPYEKVNVDPKGTNSGSRYSIRGGSYSTNAEACGNTRRMNGSKDKRMQSLGFRLAESISTIIK